MNALHRAILAGRPAEVLYLLEKRNYDPNARDRNLRTPLIICSLAEREDSAEVSAALLLRKGAQISLSDRQGKDALCWACQNSRAKLVQMFLEDYPSQFKFHLRKKDRDGNTALHLAARTGNPDTVSLLLQTYTDNNLLAEVSERNARGETPLHLAAKQGNSAAVLALLPLSSDALFRRRGGVDFRSAPKWASAAVKIGRSTGERGVKHGRPFSEQPVAGSAKANAPAARKRRSQTATVSSNLTENPHNGHTGTLNGSKPGGNVSILPRRTNISDIFKISEVQLSANSAYRRPARAPPLPQPPSVCEDDKIHCRRSSTLKLPGKGRRGSFQTSRSRSSTRRTSMTDGDAVDKQNTKPCKAVPTVVVDEPGKEAKVVPTVIIGEAGNGGTVPRPLLSMEYKTR
ncbi:receptor-interacting serine/threonine-protein kinase 4-like [Acanthaster planci]|uniref:Receptor-interacting serine/threonine-protein kinase 4-like n=1 Tax=Acanthaster planci TaxID=133434 RepID=A0A8B7Z9I5_ACAPL|nr:receptor-interacting serine/threonine-protein kinase 4-like [Acanthaster planci]